MIYVKAGDPTAGRHSCERGYILGTMGQKSFDSLLMPA